MKVRFLGFCGLVASLVGTVGGFCDSTVTMGIASAVMLAGNLYCVLGKDE